MSELEEKAANAWSLMFHHAMPATVALDFVQDLTGDRTAAMEAIIVQAVRATANSRPTAGQDTGGTFADFKAGKVGAAILVGRLDSAEQVRVKLRDQLEVMEVEGIGDPLFAALWLRWCEDAGRAIGLCSQLVVELAHPGTT